MARGFSTVVEHMNMDGFNSHGVLGFLILLLSFLTFFYQCCVLNKVSQGAASLTVCCEINAIKLMPSCASWGETGSISSDWVTKIDSKMKKHSCNFLQSQTVIRKHDWEFSFEGTDFQELASSNFGLNLTNELKPLMPSDFFIFLSAQQLTRNSQ